MANYRKSFNFRNGVQVDNDNFIVNPNGLVGIGTSVPTELLDVRGTVKVTGIVTTTDLWVSENLYVGGCQQEQRRSDTRQKENHKSGRKHPHDSEKQQGVERTVQRTPTMARQ